MFKDLTEEGFNNKKVTVTSITGVTFDFDFIYNQPNRDFFAFGWNDSDEVLFLNKSQIMTMTFTRKLP